jgi:FkbM family methyltransferase
MMYKVRAHLEALARQFVRQSTDGFLKEVRGVIHVGANFGQERRLYAAHRLNVFWIEPVPETYRTLTQFISRYSRQRAICALVTDVDGREYAFHVSNNGGRSSSIYDLGDHRKLWPAVSYTRTLRLRSSTLCSIVGKLRLNMADYDALVMDTQGSELVVLLGAAPLLRHFKFIKLEAADFESYKGCCRLNELDAFLHLQGFERTRTRPFAGRRGLGTYYDALYSTVTKRKQSELSVAPGREEPATGCRALA